jgi:hypothetical protein
MTRVTLPITATDQLGRLTETAEICDTNGRVVGYFRPAGKVTVPFSDEELDQFDQEPGGRPLTDILADLEKRT